MKDGNKERVLVTRLIPAAGIEALAKRYDVVVHRRDRPMTQKEIISEIGNAVGVLCLLTDRIDGRVMDAAPGLVGIANYAVGFDNIDVAAATSRGIPVSNTPGVLTDATAELAVALIFACARRLGEAERHLRSGTWRGWGPMQYLGADIRGATLGIVGMGKIGRAVGKRGHGLGMRIVYFEEGPVDRSALGFPAEPVSLADLLSRADFVSLHVPLNEKTRHLIGDKELLAMKPTTFLINTSRGPVVDEAALADALGRGTIAGAGLDVYEEEPKVNRRLLTLDNCVLVPHIGSATTTARANMALMAATNLIAMIEGDEVPNLVNPDYVKNKRKR
jgi:glyoxylate reductase